MPVEQRKGDLFAAHDLDALAHGCNCAGAMGKGIALEFKRLYPDMYKAYRQKCLAGEFNLGDVFIWGSNPTIFNLATQKRPGSPAELSAIETALNRMVEQCGDLKLQSVGMPRIGAGLGKLSWSSVQEVIERVGAATEVRLVVFEYK